MAIISLSGLIGSGKDTVSDYLVKEHGFLRASFADTLKDAVAAVFGWDRVMLEGKTPQARAEREKVDQWWAKRLGMPALTPRWVLQHWGTEVCRQGFSDEIWIASLEKKLMTMANKNVVVSDSRFMNELAMLEKVGATTVQVQRGELPSWWETAATANTDPTAAAAMTALGIHRSEWDWAAFSFDTIILNNGTLESLFKVVDMMLPRAATKNLAEYDDDHHQYCVAI